MNNLKIKVNIQHIITVMCFFIYPLGVFPFLFVEIYNRKRYAFTLISLFMGIVAFLISPTGDLYRHYVDYVEFKSMPWHDFFMLLPLKFDLVLYTITISFAKIGIPFEFIRFIFVFLSYEIVFYIFRDIIRRNENISRYNYIYVFFIFFFQVLFIGVAIGLRFGLSVYIILLAIYKIYVQNKNGWFYIFLGCITHFSMILIPILILIEKRINIKIKPFHIFIAICFAFVGTEIITGIITILPLNSFIKDKLLVYVSGYWGGEFLADHSFLYKISRFFNHIAIYPLLFSLFILKGKTKIRNISLILSIFLLIVFSIATLYYRYVWLILYVILIAFFVEYKQTSFRRFICSVLLIATSITFFLGGFYGHKRNLMVSKEYKLIYSSFPSLMFVRYDEKWIDENVSSDGNVL